MSATNVETQLEERIRWLKDELDNCKDPTSEVYKVLSEEYQKLYSIRNDEHRIYAEEAKAYDANELEKKRLDFEIDRSLNEKFRYLMDLLIHAGLSIFTIIVWYFFGRKLTKFEETGVATSKMWMFMPKLNFLK